MFLVFCFVPLPRIACTFHLVIFLFWWGAPSTLSRSSLSRNIICCSTLCSRVIFIFSFFRFVVGRGCYYIDCFIIVISFAILSRRSSAPFRVNSCTCVSRGVPNTLRCLGNIYYVFSIFSSVLVVRVGNWSLLKGTCSSSNSFFNVMILVCLLPFAFLSRGVLWTQPPVFLLVFWLSIAADVYSVQSGCYGVCVASEYSPCCARITYVGEAEAVH